MNKFLSCISILVLTLSLAACGEKEDSSFIPSLSSEFKYSESDATDAFNAFNENLLDKDSKLYFRDTSKPDRLGAIWTQAIYWDIAMNAYKRTHSAKNLQLIEDIYQGGYKEYDAYNWTNHAVWFIWDDMMWWIISMGRAYQLTGDIKYLNHCKAGFAHVWSGSYDPAVGGMEWAWTQRGKTACINYPTVIGAMTLYNITKDAAYLDKAKKIYTWAHNNLFDSKLGRVADHKVDANPANWTLHTYNQATCIGSAVMLYKATNEQHYLDDAVLAANYTMNTMSDLSGVLPYEGDYSDINNEQGVYNAILAQYMIRLIEDCDKPQYLPWLRKNINTAWKNRDTKRGLTTKNYKMVCPTSSAITCYDACSIVALMQVCQPDTIK